MTILPCFMLLHKTPYDFISALNLNLSFGGKKCGSNAGIKKLKNNPKLMKIRLQPPRKRLRQCVRQKKGTVSERRQGWEIGCLSRFLRNVRRECLIACKMYSQYGEMFNTQTRFKILSLPFDDEKQLDFRSRQLTLKFLPFFLNRRSYHHWCSVLCHQLKQVNEERELPFTKYFQG